MKSLAVTVLLATFNLVACAAEPVALPAGPFPIPKEAACTPPRSWVCVNDQGCQCTPYLNEAPRACVVRIIYPDGGPPAPGNVQILRDVSGCDDAGLELALAIALAKLLGAP